MHVEKDAHVVDGAGLVLGERVGEAVDNPLEVARRVDTVARARVPRGLPLLEDVELQDGVRLEDAPLLVHAEDGVVIGTHRARFNHKLLDLGPRRLHEGQAVRVVVGRRDGLAVAIALDRLAATIGVGRVPLLVVAQDAPQPDKVGVPHHDVAPLTVVRVDLTERLQDPLVLEVHVVVGIVAERVRALDLEQASRADERVGGRSKERAADRAGGCVACGVVRLEARLVRPMRLVIRLKGAVGVDRLALVGDSVSERRWHSLASRLGPDPVGLGVDERRPCVVGGAVEATAVEPEPLADLLLGRAQARGGGAFGLGLVFVDFIGLDCWR